jgi:competence protein ComEC
MEPAPLFTDKKEIIWSVFVLFCLFCLSLGWQYHNYKSIVSKPLHVEVCKVINHYQKHKKNGRSYDVFKLKSADGYSFYTVSWKRREIDIGSKVEVKFKTDKIDFLSYLRGFFALSIYIKKLQNRGENYLEKIKIYVKNQHSTKELKELFLALFFADSMSKSTREKIQKLGISHLVAISGFHLGIISAVLYFLLGVLYRFFQDRYFPYRNAKGDLAVIVFLLLFFYMYIIDFSPSFLRAFVLSLFGFFLFSRHIKIISFGTLLLSLSFILILFPRLLFSLSFWFSVSGVFYIFLFLKHFGNLRKIWVFVLINFWVFALMMPIIHYVFTVFTPLQLYSPLLSMIFIPFYPLEVVLHLINHGNLLDSWLTSLLNLKTTFYEISTPFWFLLVFVALSILSIFARWLSLLLFFLSFAIYFI